MSKGRPFLLDKAIDRIDRLDVAGLPAIRCLRDHGRRREACEALRAVLRSIAERIDIATMTIGTRDRDLNWSARGIADLTRAAGLVVVVRPHRCRPPTGKRRTAPDYRRIQRALETIGPGTGKHAKERRQGAGMVVTEQRRERGDLVEGQWIPDKRGREFRSKNAVRRVTWVFWQVLGLEVTARQQQEWHIKRLRALRPRAASLAAATLDKVDRATPTRPYRRGRAYTAPVEQITRPKAVPPISQVADGWGDLAEFRKLYDDLKRENPSLPDADCAARADEVLRSRKAAPA